VRDETNALPVPWYAAGELHLSEVVVELPGIDAFTADDDEVVALLSSGEVKVVRPDGEVDDLETAPPELFAAPPAVPDRLSIGQFDVVVQSVTTAAGGTAHLLDSSRRTDDGGAIRLSETGRRAVVVCDAEGVCAEPQTMVTGSQRIQLGWRHVVRRQAAAPLRLISPHEPPLQPGRRVLRGRLRWQPGRRGPRRRGVVR